jgi:hypothetical protein
MQPRSPSLRDTRARVRTVDAMGARTRGSWLGLAAGTAVAPVAALGSHLRRARLFHPRGIVLRGLALPLAGGEPELSAVGERLAGPVFARFSGAWWKNRQWPDVLGCALRFTRYTQLEPAAGAEAQDLLLATIRHPLTTLLAPLSTHVNDYLRNDYFGVSPFLVPPLGRVKLRLSPLQPAPSDGTRSERLERALVHGPIALSLQARADRLGARYRPIAHIELIERERQEPANLRFDPFASGRDLWPVGFVHAMRLPAYAASRRARGASERPHRELQAELRVRVVQSR